MTTDPTYPLFPICAFIGFVGCLVPLPWHLQSMNSGTCFFMFWTSISCLNYFVNSLIWADNVINSEPIWCEISIRIIMAASVGLPMSSLCIVRRLYNITKVQAVSISPSEKRRAVLFDCMLCGLFPLLFIPLQYVVQGHRFNLYENIGCLPAIYNTPLMYFTTAMWPVVIGVCSATYCALTLNQFYRRRLQFAQFLHSGSSINASRYLRLMALALTEMLISVPLGIFGIIMNATATPVGPWRSWADTHLDYDRVEQVPAIIWRSQRLLVVSFETSRWQAPFAAFVFIGFFCFAEEARKHYKMALDALCKRLGIKTVDTSKLREFKLPHPKWTKPKLAGDSAGSLPVWRPTKEKEAFGAGKKAFDLRKETFVSSDATSGAYMTSSDTYTPSSGTFLNSVPSSGAYTPSTGAYMSSTGAYMSSANAASNFSFDPVRGVMLPSSPATTAPPPEYTADAKDLPPLPRFDISSPSSLSSHSHSDSHPDVPSSPCSSRRSSSSSSSMPNPHHSTNADLLTAPQPSRAASSSSLRSTGSAGASDVIYIYDAYASDESRASSPVPSASPVATPSAPASAPMSSTAPAPLAPAPLASPPPRSSSLFAGFFPPPPTRASILAASRVPSSMSAPSQATHAPSQSTPVPSQSNRAPSPPPFTNFLPVPSPVAEPARSVASRPPTPMMPWVRREGGEA